MDIKERFYEGVKDIVLSKCLWDGKFLEDDENGRGLPDENEMIMNLKYDKI